MSTDATDAAFSIFREQIGSPRMPPPQLIANDGELQQMTAEDGLRGWHDGPCGPIREMLQAPASGPLLTEAHLRDRMLWVVRQDDVVWTAEFGPFGKTVETGVVKHTNLTGGAAAFSGGELLMFDDDSTVVINGKSGRYGPRSAAELAAVATAFSRSGYKVWSMGYDSDVDMPLPFIGVSPIWVQ